MKILILQLARLGDVYMSWPVARALKRQHPDCEIHMLVRPRFKNACEGLEAVDKIHLLPTEKMVAPLVVGDTNIEDSLNQTDEFLDTLAQEKYDRVINLSFSPVSSYITYFLNEGNTQISGYTRHADGYVHLPDDVSRYFWAQVGPGFPNRVHIVDLMGGVAGVDFAPQDFQIPNVPLTRATEGSYFVLHIGASELHKQISDVKWARLISEYQKIQPDMKWVLIGAESEKEKGQSIVNRIASAQVINKVGETRLSELFGYLQHSCGLIGGDSAPMHMVPFVDQKAFCLSAGNVKFWETGPITLGSVVYRMENEEEVTAQDLAQVIHMWSKENIQTQDSRVYLVVEDMPRYRNAVKDKPYFAWDLIRAVYMGAPFPVTSDLVFYKSCVRMAEANYVAIENLKKRNNVKRELLTSILDRVDEIFLAVVNHAPGMMPLFRWYQAEKTRIQPGTFEQIATDTLIIHEVFHSLLKKYLLEEDVRRVETHGSL